MKVFVTGADGFIGSHLVETLVERGHEVTAMAQYNSFGSHGWLESLPDEVLASTSVQLGDITDQSFVRSAVRGHDRVAHLAALIAIPHSYSAPESYLRTNAFGTLNVLEACRINDVERLVHTSTSEVYGTAQYVPIDELHPLVGQSPYSASKIAADQLAFSYWSSFALPVTTIRPFNTYGPRQSQRAFIPSVMIQLVAGNSKLAVGALDPTRDFTFVKDTALGFALALESDHGSGEVFNLASGFEVSMQKVVDLCCEITESQPEISLDPKRLRPVSSEVGRLWGDSSKFAASFGWAPKALGTEGLRIGLEAVHEWVSARHRSVGFDASLYAV